MRHISLRKFYASDMSAAACRIADRARGTFRGLPDSRFGFFGGGGPESDHRYDSGSGPSARTKKLMLVAIVEMHDISLILRFFSQRILRHL